MARLRILTLISVLLSIVVFLLKNRQPSTIPAGNGLVVNKSWLQTNRHPLIPIKDVRPPDQTFLTFPEWYLVFSPAEQATYFEKHTSTTFPYLKHVDQVWQSYGVVYHQIKGNFPFNGGYHVMIMVIAGSTTVEYGIKSWYETIAGRVTETNDLTPEDRFDHTYMDSYVRFIEDTPWYEYNFNNDLKKLWTATPLTGSHLLRKLERRYFLTTELLVKSGYGWLIKQGTKASYEPALLNTKVVANHLPENANTFTEIKNIKALKNGEAMFDLPRYADFNLAVAHLAANGVTFKEIAGNTSAIMLTILTDKPLKPDSRYTTLFTQPIATTPQVKRIALVTRVADLSVTVNMLRQQDILVEHIFDY